MSSGSGSVMYVCTLRKINSYEIQFEREEQTHTSGEVDTVSDYTFLTSFLQMKVCSMQLGNHPIIKW